MPNWCSNHISIRGPKDKIKALWDNAVALGDTGGLLQSMVPIPADEQYPETCVERWGTKWDIQVIDDPDNDLEYQEDGDMGIIVGNAETAWSPPVEAFQTYYEINPDVEIDLSYCEFGMQFTGKWSSFDDDLFEVDFNGCASEDIREVVGEELDDLFSITEMCKMDEED